MPRRATFVGLILAVAGLPWSAATGQEATQQQQGQMAASGPPNSEAVAKLLKTQLQAAQKAQRAALDKMQVNRIGGMLVLANDNHPNPEEAYTWSVRWLHAQRDLGQAKDERIAAFVAHHGRMKDLRDKVKILIADTGVLLPFSAATAAEWYLAEADLWLLSEQRK